MSLQTRGLAHRLAKGALVALLLSSASTGAMATARYFQTATLLPSADHNVGQAVEHATALFQSAGGWGQLFAMAGAQIAQHELQFNPQVTVVTVGTPVMFPNQDTVKHHVYSYSAAKTFQIKLYAGVPHTPIVFDKPGVAVLGWFRYSTTNPGTCDDTFGTRAPTSGGPYLGTGTAPTVSIASPALEMQ